MQSSAWVLWKKVAHCTEPTSCNTSEGSAVIGAHLLESQWYYNNYIWLVSWLPCSCYIVTNEIATGILPNCIAESDKPGSSSDNLQSSWPRFSHPWMLFMVQKRFQRWQETGSGKHKLARCHSDEETSHVHTQNNAKLDWREYNLSNHRSLNGSWRIIIRYDIYSPRNSNLYPLNYQQTKFWITSSMSVLLMNSNPFQTYSNIG